MQDAHFGSWQREFHISAEILDSVRGLNHRFLDLLANSSIAGAASRQGLSVRLRARVAPLSAAQKAAAADCPYALFDMRFHDDGHWQQRLRSTGRWSLADEAPVDPDTLDFVRLAVFFAWHVASTAALAAQVLLGMPEGTTAAFRDATIDCLPLVAAAEASQLSARWNDCGTYWNALIGAASRPHCADLRRIQLYGLQLAAAARLSS